MLYTTQELKAKEVEFDFGKISQITMGEKGRGRRLLALTCPPETKLREGLNTDYTIGSTKSGRPRIIKNPDDKTMYLLLSSQGGYTRRGDGYICCLKSQKSSVEILAYGNGADGDAGRIGQWACRLLRVSNGTLILVRTSGGGYGTPADVYFVYDGTVYHCHQENLDDMLDTLGLNPLYEVDDKGDFVNDEWVVL